MGLQSNEKNRRHRVQDIVETLENIPHPGQTLTNHDFKGSTLYVYGSSNIQNWPRNLESIIICHDHASHSHR